MGVTLITVMTFTPGAATSAQSSFVASPNSVVADGATTSTLTVTLRDAYNNLVPSTNATISVSGGNNTLFSTALTTNAAGVATLTLKTTRAETKTVTAAGTGFSVAAQVTFTAGLPNNTLSSLALSPNSGVVANNANSAIATATFYDAYGNPASDQHVTFTANSLSINFSLVSTTTSSTGVATTLVRSNLAAIYIITATSGAAAPTASLTFLAGPADAAI